MVPIKRSHELGYNNDFDEKNDQVRSELAKELLISGFIFIQNIALAQNRFCVRAPFALFCFKNVT